MKWIFYSIIFGFFSVLGAQTIVPEAQLLRQSELFKRSEQRINEINHQFFKPKNSAIDTDALKQKTTKSPINNQSCFKISDILMTYAKNNTDAVTQIRLSTQVEKALKKALLDENIKVLTVDNKTYRIESQHTQKTPCFSLPKIKNISTLFQNELIAKGLITSRVFIPSQDLTSQQLNLTVLIGEVNSIRFNKAPSKPKNNHKVSFWNAFPTGKGQPLNLRDLEQGLENLNNLSTVSASMDIAPSMVEGLSDVEVLWYQNTNPFTFALSLDDSGSDATGEFLTTFSLGWENPTGLSDRFFLNYTRNISSGEDQTDRNGNRDKGRTYNYSIGYSVPIGYFGFDINYSNNRHNQIVAGLNRNINYGGRTRQVTANLSKVLYRDNKHKVQAKVGVWKKTIQNFIDDVEVDVQRRRTAGWRAELSHTGFFDLGTLTTRLTYKRGTRAFGAIAAPEELFGEGTAKPKIWTLDVNWQMPFELADEKFDWSSLFKVQTNQRLLTSQDKFSIGGRYNVRGFDGEQTLFGDKGWYLRNDITWQYKPYLNPYLGLDIGRVSGPSSEILSSKQLAGVTLGVKGQVPMWGSLFYNIFISQHIDKPSNFREDDVFVGFSLNYAF